MTTKQKYTLIRIILSGVLLLAAVFVTVEMPWKLLMFLIPYALISWDVLWEAILNIFHGQFFDEQFLMALATIGALVIGEYPESVAVMLFYQVGELFQSYAVGRSRKSISSLMDICPDYANLEQCGKIIQVSPENVSEGDEILIRPGEKIPLDGCVLTGTSSVDTAALTGEPFPRSVTRGDTVLSGCINLSGLLKVKVTKTFGESTVSKILNLVENSALKKAKAENFITKFSRVYTPAVVFMALLLAVLPPLFLGNWADWLHRALIFLVVSCPCALVISVPLSFFGGIGGASRCGILVKGGNYLETLADTEIVVFDKTGTLTKGVFSVTALYPENCSEEELLEYAVLAEAYSNHPVSKSLLQAWGKAPDTSKIEKFREFSGKGVQTEVEGKIISAGNDILMNELHVSWKPCKEIGTVVYIAVDTEYMGCILISDEIKDTAAQTIFLLRQQGVKKIVMLTGDTASVGKTVAGKLGVDEVYTDLLPIHKVQKTEELLEKKSDKGRLIFVGDGINDAPVLSRVDIGIAMGAMGSDAAIESADIVLMDDDPIKVVLAIEISRKVRRIVRQNIIFALVAKAAVLLLSAFGLASMWEAVFADVGVSVIAILNAMRALKIQKK